jgi:acid phosphatase
MRTILSIPFALLMLAGAAVGCGPRATAVPVAVSAFSQQRESAVARASAPSRFQIVMMENHSYAEIVGNSSAPYINKTLIPQSMLMTESYAVSHPSLPNYLAIFSGSTHGITSDTCSVSFTSNNLAAEMTAAGKSFGGYAESIPSAGYTGCSSGKYAKKHVPWLYFSNAGPSFTRVYNGLPSNGFEDVAMIVPNLCHDMHDCSVKAGDKWLSGNLPAIINWDKANNGVAIVTWDEDDGTSGNHIATIIAGAGITPGTYAQQITHYSVLRTIEDGEGVPCIANSCTASPIPGI